jgi:hypothetical protein
MQLLLSFAKILGTEIWESCSSNVAASGFNYYFISVIITDTL